VEVVNSYRAINFLQGPAFYYKNRCFEMSAFYIQFLVVCCVLGITMYVVGFMLWDAVV
jgi:hypothetical protein